MPPFDVFISYSSKDKLMADSICAVLEQHRLRCWVAPRDIPPGSEWGASIMAGIESSRVMVLVFSRHANGSRPVRCEVERALNKDLTIVPFRIEDAVPTESLELFLSGTHWFDAFTPPLQRHLEALAARIAGIVGRDITKLERASPVLPQETQWHHAADERSAPVDHAPFTRLDVERALEHKHEAAPPHRGTRMPAIRLAVIATCVLFVVSSAVWHFMVREKGEDFFETIARRQASAEPVSTAPLLPAPKMSPTPPSALSVPDGYPTIAAALAVAKPGETVRIKSGVYGEQIRLPDGVSLAADEIRKVMVTIDGRIGSVLEVDGCKTGSTVKGIVFSHSGLDVPAGGASPVVNVNASSLTFDDCVFEKGLGPGLQVTSAARVTLTKCESRGNGGHGFFVTNASAEFKDCLTESNLHDGLRAFGTGCNVKTESTTAKRNGGTGLVAENGARITAAQTDSIENSENGVAVQGADSEALWQDGTIKGNGVLILGNNPSDSGKGGLGVSVEESGAFFSATGTVVSTNWKHGVVMMMPKTGSTLIRCKVQDNLRSGVIIFGAADTALRIDGCEITNSQADGLAIAGAGFRPVVAGTTISGSTTAGLTVLDQAEPQLEGCTLDKNGQGPIDRTEAGPGMTVK